MASLAGHPFYHLQLSTRMIATVICTGSCRICMVSLTISDIYQTPALL